MTTAPGNPYFQTEEEIDCPSCDRRIPMRVEICPHCETALH